MNAGREVVLPFSGSAPVVESDRLRLRGYTLEDWPHILEMWRAPEVTQFFGADPISEEASWTKFLRKVGHWQLYGFGYWAVEEKETGAFVGEAGFGYYRRGMTPKLEPAPEAGWAIAAPAHGKGYATEAAQAAIGWGDQHFDGDTMCCIISTDNTASVRVAEKCGFMETARTQYDDSDIIVFHRPIVQQRG